LTVDTRNISKIEKILRYSLLPDCAAIIYFRFRATSNNSHCDNLMAEQHEKADTKINRCANGQDHGKQQKFIVQHLLHKGSRLVPGFG